MKEELLAASKALIEKETNLVLQMKSVLQMLCDAVSWGVTEIEKLCLSYVDH